LKATEVFKFSALILTAAIMSGCAGTNFVRPSSDDLVVGKSTYSEVVEKLGKPYQTGEQLFNDKKVKNVVYVYAAAGGEPAESGVTPARANSYYFERDLLVGTEFTSSFKEDSTNFDDSKIEYIKKGETTRSQVMLTFGRPSVIFIPPMVEKTSGEAIGYLYSHVKGNVYTGMKQYRKALLITFSEDDKVDKVSYTTAGTK
jgi:hypothetical protein